MSESKSMSIKKYCLECAGDSALEVTLCHIFDCPLWSHRKRVNSALEKHPETLKTIAQDCLFTDSQAVKQQFLGHKSHSA